MTGAAGGRATRLHVAQTEEIDPETFDRLTALCEAAFEEPFAPVWERVGPGIHVFLEGDGRLLAHAMIVDRRLYIGHEGDLALDVGYVENVATHPDLHGRGHGTRVMREIGRIVRDEYVLGALATGRNAFYERLGAAQPRMGVEAARRAVRLAPHNGRAQLTLSQALARTGDVRGAFGAATAAVELLPDDPAAREALADAHWLADEDTAAFAEFRSLATELDGTGRERVVRKARALYRQHAGWGGRLLAAIGPAFALALRRGWLRVGR